MHCRLFSSCVQYREVGSVLYSPQHAFYDAQPQRLCITALLRASDTAITATPCPWRQAQGWSAWRQPSAGRHVAPWWRLALRSHQAPLQGVPLVLPSAIPQTKDRACPRDAQCIWHGSPTTLHAPCSTAPGALAPSLWLLCFNGCSSASLKSSALPPAVPPNTGIVRVCMHYFCRKLQIKT